MVRFSKYHGCGNDFIILTEYDTGNRPLPDLAIKMCHRQLGIGADGLIIVRQEPVERRQNAYGFRSRQMNCRNPKPSVQRFEYRANIRQKRIAHGDSNRTSRLEMIYFNSDGSRAPMCGNGIRCFAKYCFDEGICTRDEYPVITLAGIMGVKIVSKEPFLVEISMGKPDFDPKICSIDTDQPSFLRQKLQLKNREIEVSSCFMGTIHTVVWIDETEADLEALGSEICHHPVFKDQTNVNFVQVLNRDTLKLITYERGAGMTLACGTGACASVVIGALEGRCGEEAVVMLPYGELKIKQKTDQEVMMTGPAVKTAVGHFEE